MCEVFTSILARNQGEMRDFLQRGDKSEATEDYQRLACCANLKCRLGKKREGF